VVVFGIVGFIPPRTGVAVLVIGESQSRAHHKSWLFVLKWNRTLYLGSTGGGILSAVRLIAAHCRDNNEQLKWPQVNKR